MNKILRILKNEFQNVQKNQKIHFEKFGKTN